MLKQVTFQANVHITCYFSDVHRSVFYLCESLCSSTHPVLDASIAVRHICCRAASTENEPLIKKIRFVMTNTSHVPRYNSVIFLLLNVNKILFSLENVSSFVYFFSIPSTFRYTEYNYISKYTLLMRVYNAWQLLAFQNVRTKMFR